MVYCAVSTGQCANYVLVKQRILQAYELIPEAYGQKLRKTPVKQGGETHVAFARGKENAFDRWLSSMKVDAYDKLKQLALVEEFKCLISTEIQVHLDEHKVADLKSADVLADDDALTHKKSGFSPNKPYLVKSHWSGHNGVKPQTKLSNDEKVSSAKVAYDKPDESKTEQKFPKFKRGPVCFHYKKTGHLMSDYLFLRKEKQSQTQKTHVGLINSKKSEMAIEKPVLLPVETHIVHKPLERFQGGVFESFEF